MTRRTRTTIAVVVLWALTMACTKVEIPTAPDGGRTPTSTTGDRIEFRVFGSTLLTPVTIKHIDPLNGLTITTTNPPYLAAVTTTDPDSFVYLEASGFGVSTSTLQVQIFVNGKLFRESASVGSVLFASASGTVH